MANKINPLIVFTGVLLIFLVGAMFIHFYILESLHDHPHFDDLFFPYAANFVLALSITILLYLLRVKQSHNLGFIFMGSSFLKFLVFFLWFNPQYKADGEITNLEFAQFFVPYAIALAVETIFLIKILNNQE